MTLSNVSMKKWRIGNQSLKAWTKSRQNFGMGLTWLSAMSTRLRMIKLRENFQLIMIKPISHRVVCSVCDDENLVMWSCCFNWIPIFQRKGYGWFIEWPNLCWNVISKQIQELTIPCNILRGGYHIFQIMYENEDLASISYEWNGAETFWYIVSLLKAVAIKGLLPALCPPQSISMTMKVLDILSQWNPQSVTRSTCQN